MKAICIIGSPRKNGSTTYLADIIGATLKSGGMEIKNYILNSLHINYCQGCRECESSGNCVQDDDMKTLIGSLLEADVVILASPSYWGDVTGQMKVFFDRSLPLCNARFGNTTVPKGKIGIGVAIRAGSSPAENIQIIEKFRHYFGHLGIKMAASMTVENIENRSDIENDKLIYKKASDLGKTIITLLKEK
jgi:multimeric flavodoxin WrbA